MIKCIFSDVSERDMDLLYLEEFASSKDFINIFLSKINLENATVCSVEQSKTDVQWGESDITVIVQKDGCKYGLLIEDKIDADAQPNQFGRYVKRGEEDKEKGYYDKFFIFIVAPQSYLLHNDEAQKYPYHVSYEECLKYFRSKDDARSAFKAQQIEQAIEKQSRGYQVVANVAVTDFWDKYITYKEQNYPQLDLVSKRGPKGIKARWPQFNTIFNGVSIFHKSESGFVDLTIPGAGDKIITLEQLVISAVGNLSKSGVFVVKTGKSAAVRIVVAKIDFLQPFENYKNEIRECFEAVEKLNKLTNEILTLGILDSLKQTNETTML